MKDYRILKNRYKGWTLCRNNHTKEWCGISTFNVHIFAYTEKEVKESIDQYASKGAKYGNSN